MHINGPEIPNDIPFSFGSTVKHFIWTEAKNTFNSDTESGSDYCNNLS